ncbi:MAG: gliding motility-associated C-terminal domain-containing protein [Bacteroidota bacterium]
MIQPPLNQVPASGLLNRSAIRGKQRWIALLLLLVVGALGSQVNGQIVNGLLTPNSPYRTGELLHFTGPGIWQSGTCDTLVVRDPNTNIEYFFTPGTMITDSTYLGGNPPFGFIDSIYFRIPKSLPCGNLEFYVNAPPSCGGLGSGAGNPFAVDIRDSISVVYPGTDTFCLGDNNPIPIIDLAVDTPIFRIGGGFSGVLDPVTGEFGVTSAVLGQLIPVVATSDTSNPGCADTQTFSFLVDTLKPGLGINYGSLNPSFCPLDSFISPASGFGDSTFEAIPALQWASKDSGIVDLIGSPPGNYSVLYIPPHNECQIPDTARLTIIPLQTPVFQYDSLYCLRDTAAFPQITYLPNGIFFEDATTTGLVIDSMTGAINLDSSSFGTHLVRFRPSVACADTTVSDSILIYNTPQPFMVFDPDTVCYGPGMTGPQASTLNPQPGAGGYFRDTSGFVSIDTASGVVNILASTQGGPYFVFYVSGDSLCPDSITAPLTILPTDSFDIYYPKSRYCETEADPPAIFASGPTGGEFIASPPGLIINDSTGQIDLDSSQTGTYLVQYISPNTECRDTTVVDSAFVIDGIGVSGFFLPNNSPVSDTLCQGSGLIRMGPIIFQSATSGFIVTGPNGPIPGAVVNDSIDTGVVPPGGPYPITRYVNNGVCVDSTTLFLTIAPREDASFFYVEDTICSNANDPFPLLQGTTMGVFSTDPGDTVVVNASTGQVSLGSAFGTYTITYMTQGLCPDTATADIRILPANSATFVYIGQPQFCSNRDSVWIRVDTSAFFEPGGVFTFASPGGGTLFLDSLDGSINIDSSDFGTYSVTYSLTNSVCDQDFINEIDIVAADDTTTMAYPQDIFCPNDANPTPIVVGDQTGIFLGPPGLNFVDTLGTIDLGNSLSDTFQIRYSLGGSCDVTLSDTIEIQEEVLANFDYGKELFCNTDSNPEPINFVQGNGTFSATDDFGTPVPFIDSTSGEFFLNLVTDNNVNYVISFVPNSGCTDTTRRIITVFQGPTGATLDPAVIDPICDGDLITFAASGSETGYNWFVNDNQVPPLDLGTNTATFETTTLADGAVVAVSFGNLAGCVDTLSRTVSVFPNPIIAVQDTSITVSGDQEVQIPVTSFLNATFLNWEAASSANIVYNRTNDLEGPVDNGQSFTILNQLSLADSSNPALVIFTITPIAQGCEGDPLSVFVRVNPDNQAIFVPELITPNGDELNDRWLIQWRNGILPELYTMLLFNRSGGQVLRMNPLNQNFTGDNLPDGVYWYKLLDQNGNVVRTGGLTIRRK